jgi:hypothetical protein
LCLTWERTERIREGKERAREKERRERGAKAKAENKYVKFMEKKIQQLKVQSNLCVGRNVSLHFLLSLQRMIEWGKWKGKNCV